MATVEAFNTGLTEAQLNTAFSRALGDYTDAQIDTKLANKQDTLTFDSTPTEDSTNAVQSGGVFAAIAAVTSQAAWSVSSGVKNVLHFDAVGTSGSNAAQTFKSAGVRFTVNDDGTILVNREDSASGDASVYLYLDGATAYVDEHCNGGFRFTATAETSASTMYVFFGRLSPQGTSLTMSENQIIPQKTTDNIYVGIQVRASYSPNNVMLKPMIRPAEVSDQTYAPYAPTNRELYEMLLALGGAARSSAALMGAGDDPDSEMR